MPNIRDVPTIYKFLEELRSTYCKFESPTEIMSPAKEKFR